jgi:hypothetical protein
MLRVARIKRLTSGRCVTGFEGLLRRICHGSLLREK